MYTVLIVSYANWDSLMELPGVFKEAGCRVVLFCKKGSWVLNSNLYDEWIEAPEEEQPFVTQLFSLVKKNENAYQWIIAGDDLIIRILNDNINDEVLFRRLLPLTSRENRELLGSKAGFSNLCKKYNIDTPRYMIYTPGQSLDEISQYMGYPMMLKTDRSEAGTGVFKVNNKQELAATLKEVGDSQSIVFQQFIQGYDINMEVLFKDGQLVVYSYAKLLKILGKFGLSTQRLFIQYDDIQPELEKIGRSFGINGFASIAFMYSEPEKKHYLIEVDVRPNSWIYYGRFTGNDFAEGIRRIVSGKISVVKPDPAKFPKEVKVLLYKKDMMRAIVEKDLNGLMYWWLNKENSQRFVPKYDKKLLASCNQFLWGFFFQLVREKIDRTLKRGK
ncbi:MAG: ATP-grasp domain-containing protein [Chitinophagia bacterium]|nr:ATP-grasp domain-containing protein [Chitinophagia bacterium]